MAHIRRHPRNPKSWQVRYRDPTGKERSKTFQKKVDAQAFAATAEADKVRGQWINPDHARITYAEWWESWHSGRANLRRSTRKRDSTYFRSLIEPKLGTIPLGRIHRDTLRTWVTSLVDAGKAPATVRKAAGLVSSCREAAVDDGILPANPARKLPLPQLPHREMRFATMEELERLGDVIDPRWRAMVILGFTTGLRFGEIAGLKVDQLNLLARRLRVVTQLSEDAGQLALTAPKTAASRRTISLPRFVCDELARHLAEYPPGEDGFVFQAAEGGSIRRTNWRRRVWLPATEAAGLEGFRFHDLRHSHAAILIAQGEHPKVIQSRLGHASITTTLNTYGHLFDGLDVAAADRIDETWQSRSADVNSAAS